MESIKVEFVNPFVAGAFSTLSMMLGETPERGQIVLEPTGATTNQVNVVVGITGQAQGHLILGMTLLTADRIASHMIGERVHTFNALAASAISELTNMICGQAMTELSNANYLCDITPPSIIRGVKVNISCFAVPAILIPITVSQGAISLTISLRSHSVIRSAA
jgi:chemotaxis protein CheX